MLKNLNAKNPYILIFVIALSFLAGNIIWYLINTPILITESDSATHFLEIFYNLPAYNAPAITFLFKTLFFVFGTRHFDLIIILVNYIFFIGSLIMIFKITKLMKNEFAGLMATLLFSLTPVIYALSRMYGINDYQLIFPITVNMYTLMKSDFFRNRKWSLLYGLSTAFGMLVKDSFIIFFPGALIYAIAKIYLLKNKKPVLFNIFFSAFITLILISFHYFRMHIMEKILLRPLMNSGNIFEFEKISVFTIGLYEEMLSIPIFILFLIGLFYYLKKYKNDNKYILFSFLVFPWVILMLMPCDKIVAYGTAFIPALSIITSIGITSLPEKLRKTLLPIVITLCILQYISFSYNINMGFDKVFFSYGSRVFRIYNNTKDTLFYLPTKEHLSLLKINKKGEPVPDYDIRNCFALLKHIKNLKNINDGVLAIKKENESVIWKNFLKANNITNLGTESFQNFKISDKTDIIICIGDNVYFENYVLSQKINIIKFYKSEEFYLNQSFVLDNKVSVYKRKF
jgi:4-amino-4-deoxy-L-arabinose transferase-like glycosyltransferase